MASSTTELTKATAPEHLGGSARMVLVGVALAWFVVAGFSTRPEWRLGAMAAGVTISAIIAVRWGQQLMAKWRLRRDAERLVDMVGNDATPCFTADTQGQINYQNAAAEARFAAVQGATLLAALQNHFASPSAVLYRLQRRASLGRAAREDVATRRGHFRISVHQIAQGRYLWRLEEFQDRGVSGRGAETLSLPMLTANKSGVVLFSNEAMRRLLGERPKRLDRIFAVQNPHSGEEVEVAAASGPVRAILAEVEGGAERRELYLLPVGAGRTSHTLHGEFDHLPVPLLKFAAKGELLSANLAAREVLSLGADAYPAFHDLFEGLGRPVSDWLSDVAAERLPGGSEVVCARNGSGETFLQVTLRRIIDQGRPSVLAVLQDANALKTLEAQFVQSQKMQAIGQLAGGVAHDFNNLLTAISGHCDLLLLQHNSADSEYADLIQIHQNANRAAALVGQLLAFSRKQTLKPERIDLQDVLSDLAHLLNRLVGERVELQLSHDESLGQIRADKRQLEQVVMNLVVNARDAMPEGGRIRIDTEAVTLRDDMRRDQAVVPAGDYALIRISDEGCGISPEGLKKVFEPFYTTKKIGEGTGLGLSTAYGIVKQSGGFIFVDSSEGEGTVFQLYFPINAGESAVIPQSIPDRAAVARQGEGVVLLVEDEAPVRAFASRALRLRGYTVLEAENAEVALKTLEDSNLRVDVFVTDVVMPGLDGPSWVRVALQQRPDTRVIFVSGYAEDALAEGQARVPNSVFLPKPFSLSELARTVQDQLQ